MSCSTFHTPRMLYVRHVCDCRSMRVSASCVSHAHFITSKASPLSRIAIQPAPLLNACPADTASQITKALVAHLDMASILRTSSSMIKSLKNAPSAENTNFSASRADSGVWLLPEPLWGCCCKPPLGPHTPGQAPACHKTHAVD